MNILIAGGTGLVGTALTRLLVKQGHEVTLLTTQQRVSNQKNIRYVEWNPSKETHRVTSEMTFHAIINLAGSSVAKRWTNKHKESILTSRLDSTRTLGKIVQQLKHQPEVIIQASAIGYYGSSPSLQNEDSPNGNSFLANVTQQWEQVAMECFPTEIRKVIFRISTVLSNEGGALTPMVKLTRTGLASPLGSGKQHVSWIHIQDLANAFLYALEHTSMNGIYNACSNEVTTQREFAKTLANALHAPFFLPAAPAFVLKFVLGEQACLVLDDQAIDNSKLKKEGFTFQFPTLTQALEQLYGKN